jgi:HD-GYP domain-containing protein (c-di-GMP phosphodiesterase class II)
MTSALRLDHTDDRHELVTDFTTLVDRLQNHNYFSQYNITELGHGIVAIKSGFVAKVMVDIQVINNPETQKSLKMYDILPDMAIIYAGTFDQIKEVQFDYERDLVQLVGLPTSVSNLAACLESIDRFQKMLKKSNLEKDIVAQAAEDVKYVFSISRELNGERDIPKLLNMILSKAREITKADAGSIYTVEIRENNPKDTKLRFRFTQNDSIEQNLHEFELEINENSIVGNAAIHGKTINIPDLYKLDADPQKNPFGAKHDRSWDTQTGYESHSMLTVPMFDISHNVVGVIQLINSKRDPNKSLHSKEDFADIVQPFQDKDIEYAEIVAQQAGIALENANMQDEIEKLFVGFVNAAVTAIEQRDPTTSGHSHRVAHLTLGIAKLIDRIDTGPYAAVKFDDWQFKEIEYASLLHDFGKLGVRENVLVKAKKLYSWQYDLLMERFELIRSSYEIEYLKKCMQFMNSPKSYPMGVSIEGFRQERDRKLEQLEKYYEFILKANEPTVLEAGSFELLKDIANCKFEDTRKNKRPFLMTDELKALSVSRGSLTSEEFSEIQSHVSHTFEFLRKIPWGRRLINVPQIAAKHHEKLDGTGYPTGAGSQEIPIQSRMMTIADIFDALTAADRPYKKAVPVNIALDILNMEVKGGKVDPALYDVFIESKIYEEVLFDYQQPHF